MSTVVQVTIADDAYMATQKTVELISRLPLDPKSGLGNPTLDLFIERADRAMGLGPILHPSEFQAGAEKLSEVLACARSLRDARDRLAKVAGHSNVAVPHGDSPQAGSSNTPGRPGHPLAHGPEPVGGQKPNPGQIPEERHGANLVADLPESRREQLLEWQQDAERDEEDGR